MSDSTPGLTAELLADRVTPSQPVISPDGSWDAYTTAPAGVKEHRVSALWVASADASTPSRMLTSGTPHGGHLTRDRCSSCLMSSYTGSAETAVMPKC